MGTTGFLYLFRNVYSRIRPNDWIDLVLIIKLSILIKIWLNLLLLHFLLLNGDEFLVRHKINVWSDVIVLIDALDLYGMLTNVIGIFTLVRQLA